MLTSKQGKLRRWTQTHLEPTELTNHPIRLSLFLTPVYKPSISRSKHHLQTMQLWTGEAASALQDCLDDAIWELFNHSDIKHHTSAVLSYITFCTDTSLLKRTSRCPWFNCSVRKLPKARAAVLRSGDSEAYRKSGADLRRGIKDAKLKSKQRTEDDFGDNSHCTVWQSIRKIAEPQSSLLRLWLLPRLTQLIPRPLRPLSIPIKHRKERPLTVRQYQVRHVKYGELVHQRESQGPGQGWEGVHFQICRDKCRDLKTRLAVQTQRSWSLSPDRRRLGCGYISANPNAKPNPPEKLVLLHSRESPCVLLHSVVHQLQVVKLGTVDCWLPLSSVEESPLRQAL